MSRPGNPHALCSSLFRIRFWISSQSRSLTSRSLRDLREAVWWVVLAPLAALVGACGDETEPLPLDGACCSSAACVVILEAECPDTSRFLGRGTVCEPDPCPSRGACCEGGLCSLRWEDECLADGGSYWGEESECPLEGAPAGDRGRNADGILLLHYSADLEATRQGTQPELTSCEEFVVSGPGDGSAAIVFAFAAFPEWVSPRVAGVVFGIRYSTVVTGWGSYLDFQLPSAAWPESGSGIALTVGVSAPISDRIFPLGWFSTYAYDGSYFELADHPQHGIPYFADDSIPALLDPVDALGRVGFGTARGRRPCTPCE